jgi:hypothetical protein
VRVDSAIAQYAVSGPLLQAERQASETPRSVTAQEYRDAYCAKWTDGCAVCERATIEDEPKCRTIDASTCERAAVECRALLKTVGRVCLAYQDGCNACAGGFCTLLACPIKQADGTFRQKDLNFRCTTPRRQRYDEASQLLADLKGHWKLTDPRGRTCEIVNGFGVWLTPACIALGDPVVALRLARMSGETFQLTRYDGEVLLSFDATNPDDLAGTGSSQGYRLIRLEAEPIDPRAWEGRWRMRHDGSACDLFLVMRPRVIGPRPFVDVVQEPQGLSFASNCLDPADPDSLRIPHLDNAIPPLLLPAWTDWRTEGHSIVFADRNGRITRFASNADGTWMAKIPQSGSHSITLRLEPAAR